MPPDLQSRLLTALDGVDDPGLRSALSAAIQRPRPTAAMARIEDAFRRVTEVPPGDPSLRWFFRSWMMTNNSAMCVSGLGNRISMELRECPDDAARLAGALVSLHRIADEDLGVGSGLLHADLFYAMATALVGDDAWQSKRYLTPEAETFKKWKDRASLVEDDLVVGLLSTVVHEVYTHAEVELLWPLFNGWVDGCGWSAEARRRALLWVKVHCGGTELDHFGHAVDALTCYLGGLSGLGERADLDAIVEAYLDLKAATMVSIVDRLDLSDTGAIAFATVG